MSGPGRYSDSLFSSTRLAMWKTRAPRPSLTVHIPAPTIPGAHRHDDRSPGAWLTWHRPSEPGHGAHSEEEAGMTRPVRQQRRKFIQQTAALSVAAASGTLGFPAIVRGQGGPLKLGVLHPVTGPLAYSGNLSRLGAKLAIDEINAAGGLKALGGAKIEPILRRRPAPRGGGRGSREAERGRRERDRGSLCERDLPRHDPGGRQAQHPARRRRRGRRPDRRARAEEHLPLRTRLPRDRDRRHERSAHHEQAGALARHHGDDHPRGVAVRHRDGEPARRSCCPVSGTRWSR